MQAGSKTPDRLRGNSLPAAYRLQVRFTIIILESLILLGAQAPPDGQTDLCSKSPLP